MPGKLLSVTVAVVAVAAAACSDSAVLEPRSPSPADLRPALAVEPRYPVVILRSDHTPPTDAGAPVVDNFQDAVARVEPGGSILVHPGTYLTGGVVIDKPLTIRAVGSEMPVVEGVGSFTSFTIRDVSSGLVRIGGLRFRNTTYNGFSGVFITGQIDRVEIENSEFYPGSQPREPGTLGYNGGISPHRVRAAAIVIRNNRFIGGDIGVHAHDALGLVVLNNTFSGQSNVGVHISDGSGGRVEGNTFRDCGYIFGCIGLFGAAFGEILDNKIAIRSDHPSMNGLFLTADRLVVERNVITGTGGTQQHGERSSYAIHEAGISASAREARISGNSVSNAYKGLNVNVLGLQTFDPWVTGTDNVFDRVDTGLELWGTGVSIRRSDVTNYRMAFNGFGLAARDLACNWWGTPAGPQNMEWYLHRDVYTPWATEPIANRPSVSCE